MIIKDILVLNELYFNVLSPKEYPDPLSLIHHSVTDSLSMLSPIRNKLSSYLTDFTVKQKISNNNFINIIIILWLQQLRLQLQLQLHWQSHLQSHLQLHLLFQLHWLLQIHLLLQLLPITFINYYIILN